MIIFNSNPNFNPSFKAMFSKENNAQDTLKRSCNDLHDLENIYYINRYLKEIPTNDTFSISPFTEEFGTKYYRLKNDKTGRFFDRIHYSLSTLFERLSNDLDTTSPFSDEDTLEDAVSNRGVLENITPPSITKETVAKELNQKYNKEIQIIREAHDSIELKYKQIKELRHKIYDEEKNLSNLCWSILKKELDS